MKTQIFRAGTGSAIFGFPMHLWLVLGLKKGTSGSRLTFLKLSEETAFAWLTFGHCWVQVWSKKCFLCLGSHHYYCHRRRKRILGIVVINALQCQSIYVNPIHLCGQLSKKFLNVLKQMTVIVIYWKAPSLWVQWGWPRNCYPSKTIGICHFLEFANFERDH